MNCRDLQQRFDERLDHRLNVAEQQAFDEHVAGCAGCQREWQAYRGIWDTLGRQSTIEPSCGFVDRTLRRLDERPTPFPVPRRHRQWRWAALAVVVVGLAAGGLLFRQRQERAQLAKLYSEVARNDYLEDYDVIVWLDQLEGDSKL